MREPLDLILVERRLVESRRKAQWLIRNGYVLVEGNKIKEPGKRIDNRLKIELIKKFPYVSRGGLKLEKALKDFDVSTQGKVCADIGVSRGGFTDCLIQHGAKKVYALDSATNLLHPSLRCKKMKGKVKPILGIDARTFIKLEEKVDICTLDITMTPLKDVLPNVKHYLKKNGDIIALIKPVFEIINSISSIPKTIENPEDLEKILEDFILWCENHAFYVLDLLLSPIKGKNGSYEFLVHIKSTDQRKINLHKTIQEELAKIR